MDRRLEVLTDLICSCGEGPVWDSENARLYWIDIPVGDILCFSIKENKIEKFSVEQKIGSIALAGSGRLIAALKSGFYAIDFPGKQMAWIVNPESDKPQNRFNDGKCDPAGRFWAGSMSDGGVARSGTLYTLEKNGSVSKKLEGLSIPNGMAWDLNKCKYYHIDTPTNQVVAYDYDDLSGGIENGKVVVEIDKKEGVPDGMTIDSEGMLWIAHWNGGRVSRWDPDSAEKLEEILLPVAKVTSCIFGGENMDELFITTARIGLSEEELIREPLAGKTFVLKQVDVTGVPQVKVDINISGIDLIQF